MKIFLRLLNNILYKNKNSSLKTIVFYFFSGLRLFFIKNPFYSSILRSFYKRFFDYPKLLYIHPFNSCNLRCLYCYEQKELNKSKKRMSIEDYKSIIDEAYEQGVSQIHILGGEPFMFEQIFTIFDIIKDKGLDFHVYTNGTYIDKKILKRLEKYKKNISILVSLHPHEVYKKITGKKYYFRVLRNLMMIKSVGFNCAILLTASKANVLYIEDFFEKVINKYGFNVISERFLPVSDSKINEEFLLNNKEWNYFLKIKEKYDKKNKFIPFSKITPVLRGYGCNDFYESIHIDMAGNVSPCEYVMNYIKIGNIKEQGIKKIWKKYKKNRKVWMKKGKECSECNKNHMCGGGCKAFSFLTCECFDIKDPLCDRKQIPFA